jgi:hypothetical protein
MSKDKKVKKPTHKFQIADLLSDATIKKILERGGNCRKSRGTKS